MHLKLPLSLLLIYLFCNTSNKLLNAFRRQLIFYTSSKPNFTLYVVLLSKLAFNDTIINKLNEFAFHKSLINLI